MSKIKSIDILNFKVFRHREYFELDGKNLLVYGTNGSGKSSFFWSIYTFLQSSNKKKEEVKKYFDPENNQNLRNIFSSPTDSSFIKMKFMEENGIKVEHEIGVNITENPHYEQTDEVLGFFNGEVGKEKYLKAYTHSTFENAEVRKANIASDFINYRLLLNFYNSSHKHQTNLFEVFERDIFPFFTNSKGESLADNYQYLFNNSPEVQKQRLKAEEGLQRLKETRFETIKSNFEAMRTSFNKDLDALFGDLNREGNLFLKKHFSGEEDKYEFKIDFRRTKEKVFELRLNDKGTVANPYITLNVWQKDSNNKSKQIWRPHSFLNEAKLTQFALSIRLAALKIKLQKSPSLVRLLVVDDLLISLDMENRLTVLDIILKEFKEYQLMILTHDKNFFDLVSLKTKEEEWLKLEFYGTEGEGNPIMKINGGYLQRAEMYLKNKEFDIAAVMLRKKAESMLKIYLDPNLKQLTAFDTKDTLSDFLKKAKKYPFNEPYDKFVEFMEKVKISAEDLDNFNIKKDSLKDTVVGDKITEMIAFMNNFLEISKTQLEWIKNSEKMRADLTQVIANMEDLSARILNTGAHASTSALHEKEVKNAIDIVKDAEVKLGLVQQKKKI